MFSNEEIAIFQEELEEKMQIISDNILLLEQRQATPEVIQEIFRAAHTIKGSSAVMGYDKMTELTHELESLFDEIRHDRLEITGDLVDVLFEAVDKLRELKDEITGNANENVDISPVLQRIKQVKQTPGVDINNQYESDQLNKPVEQETSKVSYSDQPLSEIEVDDVSEDVIGEAEIRGYYAYRLQVVFAEDCQMKEVRAFLLIETLEQVGEIIKTNPPIEDIQSGHFNSSIALIILSQSDVDQVENLALSVAEINVVHIQKIKINNTPEQETQNAADRENITEAAPAAAKLSNIDNNGSRKTIKTVRIDVEKLNILMNLVGELVIERTRLDRFVNVFESKFGSEDIAEDILEISSHLGKVTTDLQDEIMKARMLPVAQVFNRFPRMVRDVAHKLGKEIDFIIEGKETELDRNVIEVIGDPLIHLLRNSIDHGIEDAKERQRLGKPAQGSLKLKASYSEGHIVITVEDDGRGIDAQKLKKKALQRGLITQEQYDRMSDREAQELIFAPGFSTVEEDHVSDISGRGVGMDIVRNQIENINGIVDYYTVPGQGTRFSIKLPLTLAIIRALMVEHGSRAYAFPLTYVVETLYVNRSEIKTIRHSKVIIIRGQVCPLKRLGDIFNHETSKTDDNKVYVVIVGSGDRKLGIIVDELIGEQEIVIKSLGSYLGQVEGLAGAAILGDGKVSLIVDVRSLVRSAGSEEALSYAAAD